MVDNPDVDRMTCLESDIVQAQPLKANSNTYEYRNPSVSKSKTDIPTSNRSASSLANNNSKFGSQGSLRSAISNKEYAASNFSNTGRQDDDSSLLTKGKYNESISSASTDRKTPVPAHRRNLSKLHLIDSVPQTEV